MKSVAICGGGRRWSIILVHEKFLKSGKKWMVAMNIGWFSHRHSADTKCVGELVRSVWCWNFSDFSFIWSGGNLLSGSTPWAPNEQWWYWWETHPLSYYGIVLMHVCLHKNPQIASYKRFIGEYFIRCLSQNFNWEELKCNVLVSLLPAQHRIFLNPLSKNLKLNLITACRLLMESTMKPDE